MVEKQDRFDKIVGLIRILIWPISLFIIFFIFYGQISTTIKILTDKLHESNKIITSYFTIEVSETARKEGKSQLIPAIEGLSSDGVTLLLQTGDQYFAIVGTSEIDSNYFIPANMKVIEELVNKGLLQLVMKPRDQVIYKKDFSGEPLEQVLKNLSTEFKQSAIDELAKRGYYDLFRDLIKNDSLSVLYFIKSFPLKYNVERKALLIDKKLSKDEIKQLQSIDYQLTPSGKDAFYLIVHVVSQQFAKTP